MQVIPAIIAENFEQLQEKIKLIKPYSQWAQLDVMDGKFVSNITFNNPAQLRGIKDKLQIEVHLMIDHPADSVEKWLKNGAQRAIIHWESLGHNPEKQFLKIYKIVKTLKKELGIAINPETSLEEIKPYIPKVNLILLMTVYPGFGGQKFIISVLKKIEDARREFPNLNIEVDGGINKKTAKACIQAGANILVSGSYIFKGNIKKNLGKLNNL